MIEAIVILAAAAVIAAGFFMLLHAEMLRKQCESNLGHIYSALEMYEADRGSLPRVAFFADDAQQDPHGLAAVLRPYGVQGDVCVCPACPKVQRATGLTYVWNVQLNGRKLKGEGSREWMVTEINALSDEVPAPHLGRYNILYTDGTIERASKPPQGLR